MMVGDYTEIWNKIKEHIDLISGNKVIKYSKDFMKIIILYIVFLKTVNITHKFCYMIVFMNMSMNMKKVQIFSPLIKWQLNN